MKKIIVVAAFLFSCGPTTVSDYMSVCMEYCWRAVDECGSIAEGGCDAFCGGDRYFVAEGGQDCIDAAIEWRECQLHDVCHARCSSEAVDMAAACD